MVVFVVAIIMNFMFVKIWNFNNFLLYSNFICIENICVCAVYISKQIYYIESKYFILNLCKLIFMLVSKNVVLRLCFYIIAVIILPDF